MKASLNGHLDIVRLLLDRGAEISKVTLVSKYAFMLQLNMLLRYYEIFFYATIYDAFILFCDGILCCCFHSDFYALVEYAFMIFSNMLV